MWVSFYVNREKVNFSTKVKVEEKHWSEKKQCILSGDKECKDKTLIIENIVARINNVFVKYRLRDKKITRDAFLKAYHRPTDFDTFFDWVKFYQRKLSARTELSTLQTHYSVINKLKEYNANLALDDITPDWLDDYFSYLRKTLDNCSNTAYKNMSIIKKYVRAAYKGGYIDENPFEDWSIKRTTSTCIYLTKEELRVFVDAYKNGELDYQQHKTLEFFLFLCFSSLHIGDAKRLTLEQFNEDTFTYFRMKLRNSKPMPIRIPVSDTLKKLLINIVGTRKRGPVFENLPTDQAMNRILKDIAAMLEVDKPISHKVGRHTFATFIKTFYNQLFACGLERHEVLMGNG